MASYIPKGKDVPEWSSEFKAPSPTSSSPYQPGSTGSTTDFNRPWPGDVEARPGAFSRVATGLQSNLGNYLLYRATQTRRPGAKATGADPDPVAPPLGGPLVGPDPRHWETGPRPHGPGDPSELGTGPKALGRGGPILGTDTPDSWGHGSASPVGPSRAGTAPERNLNQVQSEQGTMFARQAFSGPIVMGPRPEDRRPKGADRRGPRYQQTSLF